MRGEGTGRRRKQCSDLGRASDQILGNNNIGDGPFNLLFHARPAAWNNDILAEADMKSYRL